MHTGKICVSYIIYFLHISAPSQQYLLTPWSRAPLEKLTGSAASQEIHRIFGTWRFLTVLTSARHLSLSWANAIQSPQLPPTSWKSILMFAVCYKAIYDDKMKVLETSPLHKYWYNSKMKALVQTSLQKYLYKREMKGLLQPSLQKYLYNSEMKGLVQTSLEKYLYKSEMKCSVQISLDKYL